MTADVTIRPLERGDGPRWRELWCAYLAFYKTTRPDEVYDTYFERLLGDDPRDYNGLVAEVGGQVEGLTHYLFHRHGQFIEDTCYLQDLFVAPGVRGLGVGRALIEGVYAAADAAGACQVYWLTQEDNTQARKLYDQVGILTPFIKYQRT